MTKKNDCGLLSKVSVSIDLNERFSFLCHEGYLATSDRDLQHKCTQNIRSISEEVFAWYIESIKGQISGKAR